MPELPDLVVYLDAMRTRMIGRTLDRVVLASPFVLRSVDPPIGAVSGRVVQDVRRIGKRLVLALDDDLFLVVHLMIAGRLRWRDPGKTLGMGKKLVLASFEFAHGTLWLTEASSTKRASL